MTQPASLTLPAVLAACALVAGAAHAQTGATEAVSSDANVPPATAQKQASEIARGDPARWFREDLSAAGRLRNLQKEIGAALQEAQGACRKLAPAERAGCMAEARTNYQQDMAGARARAMADSG